MQAFFLNIFFGIGKIRGGGKNPRSSPIIEFIYRAIISNLILEGSHKEHRIVVALVAEEPALAVGVPDPRIL